MQFRRNNFDVTNTVNVTDSISVGDAIEAIFLDLFPSAPVATLRSAMAHISRLYRGELPGYAACDTGYHDLQHTMDVTLASARLIDGYERSQKKGDSLGEELFVFGILLALFHDSGYLRKRGIEDNRHGAEFTMVHVSRGEELLKEYLKESGMGTLAETAARVVHYTGYEIPVARIQVPSPAYRAIGNLVASADILAQMSDRCYLEKCHDRLYTEFVLGGIARKRDEHGNEQVIFASPQDLVIKTPGFYRGAKKRLEETLNGAYRYAEKHFGGQNLYLEALERNIMFAEYVAANNGDIGMLQRTPPTTVGSEQTSHAADDRKQLVEERRKRIGDRRTNTGQTYPDLLDRRKNTYDRRLTSPGKTRTARTQF
ncbi:MAG: HD domain-containing protein [Nitrosomonadales bacterium]|nr:HD domain-containing protein [Nitrosomonadales bacterium]